MTWRGAFAGRRSPSSPRLLTLVCIGGALFAPWLAPQNPFDLATLDLNDAFIPPAWSEGGKAAYPLGTDDQGRDVLSTILYGARMSLARRARVGAFRARPRRVARPRRRATSAAGSTPSSCASPTSSSRFPPILIALLDRRRGARRAAERSPRRDRDPRADPRHRRLGLGAVRAHGARLDAGREETRSTSRRRASSAAARSPSCSPTCCPT